MDDDSWIARSVLGATLSVSLGLFTVALCHYLGVARLMLALSSTEPSSYTWMYPAFAKAIYPEMTRVATQYALARGLYLPWVSGCVGQCPGFLPYEWLYTIGLVS